MILIDLQLQVIVCDVCREELEIKRSLLRDQHALLELKDETKKDHRECAQFPHDVERAIRERGYRKRLQREMAKHAGKQLMPRPRCNGRTHSS